jgi:hypothetical protein
MRVKVTEDGCTTVTLSRRNLLTLVAKLDGNPPGSACTIGAPRAYGEFWIVAEEDDVHYAHPDRAEVVGDARPGVMHPDTEAALS